MNDKERRERRKGRKVDRWMRGREKEINAHIYNQLGKWTDR